MSKMVTIEAVEVPVGTITLKGDLRVPPTTQGLVIFAHGSGSSRFSRRNRQVAEFLGDRRFATLLLDLLTGRKKQLTKGRRNSDSTSPASDRVSALPQTGRQPGPTSARCASAASARAPARQQR